MHISGLRPLRKKRFIEYLLSNACAMPGTRAVPPITNTAWRYLRIFSSPPAALALLKMATSRGSLLASKHTSMVYPPGNVGVGWSGIAGPTGVSAGAVSGGLLSTSSLSTISIGTSTVPSPTVEVGAIVVAVGVASFVSLVPVAGVGVSVMTPSNERVPKQNVSLACTG